MKTQNSSKSKFTSILVPMLVIVGIISIAKSGYQFGQWLQNTIN